MELIPTDSAPLDTERSEKELPGNPDFGLGDTPVLRVKRCLAGGRVHPGKKNATCGLSGGKLGILVEGSTLLLGVAEGHEESPPGRRAFGRGYWACR